MLEKYRHFPLGGPRTIRVLYLHPALTHAEPIRCSLKAISLDDFPKWHANYTALSYSWDAQKPSCEVDCDGDGLFVTPNCDAAMRQLRMATKIRTCWIDSICIDQSSEAVQQRNHQVALMGEIYKSAGEVIIWLGESNSGIENALKTILHIAERTREFSGTNKKELQAAAYEPFHKLASNITRASEDPIGPLFDCSWFHRMWTIQEVTLCHFERAWIRCGSLKIPWPVLLLGFDGLKSAEYQWGQWKAALALQKQLFIHITGKRMPRAKEAFNDEQNHSGIQKDPLVYSFLINTRGKQATDPKDKVFALYGLLVELEIPFPRPDYSLSVEDVYREAVIASIEYDKNVHILCHAPSDRRRNGLASWVPDWAEPGFEPDDPRFPVVRDRFAASGGNLKWRFSEDRSKLTLFGKIIDAVIFCADPLPDISHLSAKVKGRELDAALDAREIRAMILATYSILKTWVEMSHWADYPTGEETKSALQRTLGNDTPEYNRNAAENDAFEKWYEVMQLNDLDLAERALRNQNLEGVIPEPRFLRDAFLRNYRSRTSDLILVHNALRGDASRFHYLAIAFSQKKCFFYTQNGYFGTAPDPLPDRIRPGDKIAIVSGLELPLLLRPVEGKYKLITHVYVHGIMHGSAWPESEEELEDIALV